MSASESCVANFRGKWRFRRHIATPSHRFWHGFGGELADFDKCFFIFFLTVILFCAVSRTLCSESRAGKLSSSLRVMASKLSAIARRCATQLRNSVAQLVQHRATPLRDSAATVACALAATRPQLDRNSTATPRNSVAQLASCARVAQLLRNPRVFISFLVEQHVANGLVILHNGSCRLVDVAPCRYHVDRAA